MESGGSSVIVRKDRIHLILKTDTRHPYGGPDSHVSERCGSQRLPVGDIRSRAPVEAPPYACSGRCGAMTPEARGPVISLMLAVPDTSGAAHWYNQAFGATELWKLGGVVGLAVEGAPFFLGEPANSR